MLLKWWEWRGLLGDSAWMPSELVERMGLTSVFCARRYLRAAYFLGTLERKRWGRYWYYLYAKAMTEQKGSVCISCGNVALDGQTLQQEPQTFCEQCQTTAPHYCGILMPSKAQ